MARLITAYSARPWRRYADASIVHDWPILNASRFYIVMMAREAAWMINEEVSYTCHTRRNYYITNDMLDGPSTSYRQTSGWHRLYEASIAIMHKQINEIGAE